MAEEKTRDPRQVGGESKGGESKGGESKTNESNFIRKEREYIVQTPPEVLAVQTNAILNLCKVYNERVTLSEMRFYPTGGSLYRFFWEQEKCNIAMPECFATEDIDGFIVVVPRGMTQKQLDDFGTGNITHESILAIAKEAYDKVFYKNSGWLDTPDGENYTLLFPPQAFDTDVDIDLSDRPKLAFHQAPVYNKETYQKNMGTLHFDLGLLMNFAGKQHQLDLHFGILQPPGSPDMANLYDVMYGAERKKANLYIMTKKHFLVDQLETALTRLYDFFALAVLDKDRNPTTWQLKKVLGKENVVRKKNKKHGALKAVKNVCRIVNFSKMYSEFRSTTLNELYDERKTTPIQEYRSNFVSNKLRVRVGQFNALVMHELNNRNSWFGRRRYPNERNANGRLNLTQYEKVVRTHRLLCDDMLVLQVVMVLEHMTDSIRDKGEAAVLEALEMNRNNVRDVLLSSFKLKEGFNLQLRF